MNDSTSALPFPSRALLPSLRELDSHVRDLAGQLAPEGRSRIALFLRDLADDLEPEALDVDRELPGQGLLFG